MRLRTPLALAFASAIWSAASVHAQTTIAPDFRPNPTVIEGLRGTANHHASRALGIGDAGCDTYVTDAPVVIVAPRGLGKTRFSIQPADPGATDIVVRFSDGRFVCKTAQTIAAASATVAAVPAGRIEIWAGFHSNLTPLTFAVTIEDPDRPVEADPAMKRLFATLDWKCCAGGGDNQTGVTILQRARIDEMSIQKHGSPDPEWLPRWPGNQFGYELANAFVQGAINKTWQAQCLADYDDYRARWRELDEKYRPELERLRSGSYYERVPALRALFDRLRAEMDAQKLVLPERHPARFHALPHDVVAAAVAALRDAGREYLSPALRLERAWGEARVAALADDDAHRDGFCLWAESTGTHRTPPLPKLWGTGVVEKATRWHEDARQAAAIAAVPEPPRAPEWDDGAAKASELPESMAKVEEGEVSAVATRAGGVTLTIASVVKKDDAANCRSTNRISRVSRVTPGNYQVHYGEVCASTRHSKWETVTTVAFAREDLPAGVELRRGDRVTLYGITERDQERTVIDRPLELVVHRTVTLKGQHLDAVKRGGAAVFKFLPGPI